MKRTKRNIYLIADTHFNHEKVKEYCNRPDNFEDLIWKGLNELPKDCLLIHLGDICIGKDKEAHEKIRRLPYEKILVRGNHDKKSNTWYLNNGWDKVYYKYTIRDDNYLFYLTHRPLTEIEEYAINIHGHLHNKRDESLDIRNHILVSLEELNYKPISLNDLLIFHDVLKLS